MKPKRSLETLKISRYDHGGGRIYFDDGTDRELVADAYHEADRELIYEAIKARLGGLAEEPDYSLCEDVCDGSCPKCTKPAEEVKP